MPTQSYWRAVLDNSYRVPGDRSLPELTTELVTMLGDPNPARRDRVAYAVLARWVAEGVYDELLHGLGDGVAAGLRNGVGEDGTDTVFRRSYSALVLADAIHRDTAGHLLTDDAVLRWGDLASTWYLRERDLRGHVPGKGWAHTVAHGADLLGALARSRHFGAAELAVLLDVVLNRLVTPTPYGWRHGEEDRLAYVVMAVLHRGVVDAETLTEWVHRLGAAARPPGEPGPPTPAAVNMLAFLRALHLQLLLGVHGRDGIPGDDALFEGTAPGRADAVLALQTELRLAQPWLFTPPDASR